MEEEQVYEAPKPKGPTLKLIEKPKMNPKTFQQLWGSFSVSFTNEHKMENSMSKEIFEKLMANRRVYVIAGGSIQDILRFFTFSRDESQLWLLCEIRLNMGLGTMQSTIRVGFDDDSSMDQKNMKIISQQFIEHLTMGI